MDKTVLIKLGEFRQAYLYDLNKVVCKRNDYVILELDKAFEFGRVVSSPRIFHKGDHLKGKVLRKATDGDLKQVENNRMKAKDAFNICLRKINEQKLPMKMVKAEYTFDSSKIIFSFTSEGRVDFRSLVKDLARVFRVRIELRQIGVRDKAKIINGYGICGREFCCSSYIKSFHSLSIRMAKDQGLPLNPSRISGVCGRIKCCMAYEFNVYKEALKKFPRIGEKINISGEKGKVVDRDILKRSVSLDIGDGKIIKVVIPEKEKPVKN